MSGLNYCHWNSQVSGANGIYGQLICDEFGNVVSLNLREYLWGAKHSFLTRDFLSTPNYSIFISLYNVQNPTVWLDKSLPKSVSWSTCQRTLPFSMPNPVGPIPTSLGLFRGLETLDVESNNMEFGEQNNRHELLQSLCNVRVLWLYAEAAASWKRHHHVPHSQELHHS